MNVAELASIKAGLGEEAASQVVLNFTLQFIPLALRQGLIDRIHAGLLPGGMLVLSEKIRFEDADLDALFIDMHHRFKVSQGYTELEAASGRHWKTSWCRRR